MEKDDYYLRIGKASDLKNPKERFLFRLFEILPGAISWTILLLIVLLSWSHPFLVAVFIIVFVIFWFLRTFYFSLHLWAGYKKMAENEKIELLFSSLSP